MTRLLSDCLIREHSSIRDALMAIESGSVSIALVVDDNECLLGTVSDGDIRRALLAGYDLDDGVEAHVMPDPKVVTEGHTRPEVLNLMRAQALTQIPVVDRSGKLVGLHLLRELLGDSPRPNWAVIMAGGRGTRLAPLTDTIPKPMLRVAGRPILERLVLHLAGSGIRRIFLSVNYLSEMIEEHFGDGSDLGCEIIYLKESPDRQLGTAGSLRLMLDGGWEPEHPMIVMNGDLVTELSVENLLSSHVLSAAAATMAVRTYSHTVPFGVAETVGNRLSRLMEKPAESWLINAGIYVLEPHLLERVPSDRMYHVTELLEGCLDRGEHVHAWETDDEWQDVGRPEEFRRANGRSL